MNKIMNHQNEKITSSKTIEEQERLKAKYEAEIAEANQKLTELENTIIKKDDEIFELQKENKRAVSERDEWKRDCHIARKIQSETKQTKEATDFKTEFIKLQTKKGLHWDEAQQKWL